MRASLTSFYKMPLVVLTPFHRPPHTARVKTFGSFSNKITRSSVLLQYSMGDQSLLCKTYSNHKNSTEAEVCSVLDGIQYSLNKNQDAIELENNNLDVVNNIINNAINPGMLYEFHDYYNEIHKEIGNLEYFGIRWIPRKSHPL